MAENGFNEINAIKAYAGVDVGSSRTKAVLLDAKKQILGYGINKSGTDLAASAQNCLDSALQMAGLLQPSVAYSVATGYGRNNVAYADATRTEIGCHARGCFHFNPQAMTIIDIGGQDNKVIRIDAAGRRAGFKMNRKCAAGTGAFLEEMALRLDVPLEEMNGLAAQSQNMVRLGSFCTVFSATEVLENIRRGKAVTDIVKGVFFSMIQRILEMDPLAENVAMTGGVVAHNPYLVTMTEELIKQPIFVPDHPQFSGAIGAALYALECRCHRELNLKAERM